MFFPHNSASSITFLKKTTVLDFKKCVEKHNVFEDYVQLSMFWRVFGDNWAVFGMCFGCVLGIKT